MQFLCGLEVGGISGLEVGGIGRLRLLHVFIFLVVNAVEISAEGDGGGVEMAYGGGS